MRTHRQAEALNRGDGIDMVLHRNTRDTGRKKYVVIATVAVAVSAIVWQFGFRGQGADTKVPRATPATAPAVAVHSSVRDTPIAASRPAPDSAIAPKTEAVRPASAPQSVPVAQQVGGTLAGTVLRGDKPVPKISVTAIRDSDQAPASAETETDDKGRFSFKGLAPGKVEVRAEFQADPETPLLVRARTEITATSGAEVTLRFPEAAGSLHGVVTVGGQPVAEGLIEVTSVGDSCESVQCVPIAQNGEYSAKNLAGGEVRLSANALDADRTRRCRQITLTLSEGEQRAQDIAFDTTSAVNCELKSLPRGRAVQLVLLRGAEPVNPNDPKLEHVVESRTVLSKTVSQLGPVRLDGIDAGEYLLLAVLAASNSEQSEHEKEAPYVQSHPVRVLQSQTTPVSFTF